MFNWIQQRSSMSRIPSRNGAQTTVFQMNQRQGAGALVVASPVKKPRALFLERR